MPSKPATTSVSARWMITALLLSPLHSMPSLCKPAPGAPNPVKSTCISGTPFCFPQAFDHSTGISMALIQPPNSGTKVNNSEFLPTDFIANISTPLPYGFAGMGGTHESEAKAKRAAASPEFSAYWWIGGLSTLPLSEPNGSQIPSPAPIVQIFEESSTANVLTRVQNPLDAGAKITISPRSFQSATVSHMIFRCQNCPIPIINATLGSSTGSVKLATSISSAPPVPANATGNLSAAASLFTGSTVLPLAGIRRGSIVVEPFRTEEYEAIARILQVD